MNNLSFCKSILIILLLVNFFACHHGKSNAKTRQVIAFQNVANKLIVLKKHQQALKKLLQAHKLNKNDPNTNYLLGLVYYVGFNKIDTSIKFLNRAIKTSKTDFPNAQNLLGTLLLEKGDFIAAIKHLKKAENNLLYETPYFAQQNLGIAYGKLNQHKQAISYLNKALKTKPMLCGAYYPLLRSYLSLDNNHKAKNTALKFIKHCDNKKLDFKPLNKIKANMYYNLALAYINLKQNDQAKSTLQQCIQRFSAFEVAPMCQNKLNVLN